jgi:RimJ/RimL family protein N-acetyltransferase
MFVPKLPIETERLRLRANTPADLDNLHGLFGREDVSRYLMWEPMSREAAIKLLERRVAQSAMQAEGEAIALVVEDRATAGFLGEVILMWKSEESRQGEIGWALHPDAHGKGYATEAAREMLRMGFDGLGLHRIAAECDPRNDASIRVMERLGMRREAHHVDNLWLKGEWVGSVIYAILADEWRRQEQARR